MDERNTPLGDDLEDVVTAEEEVAIEDKVEDVEYVEKVEELVQAEEKTTDFVAPTERKAGMYLEFADTNETQEETSSQESTSQETEPSPMVSPDDHDYPETPEVPPVVSHDYPDTTEVPPVVSQDYPETPEVPPVVSQDYPDTPEVPPVVSQDYTDAPEVPPVVSQDDSETTEVPPMVSHDYIETPEAPPMVSHDYPDTTEVPPVVSHDYPDTSEVPPMVSQDYTDAPEVPPMVSHDYPDTSEVPPVVSQDCTDAPEVPPMVSHDYPDTTEVPPVVSHDYPDTTEVSPVVSQDYPETPEVPPVVSHDYPENPEVPPMVTTDYSTTVTAPPESGHQPPPPVPQSPPDFGNYHRNGDEFGEPPPYQGQFEPPPYDEYPSYPQYPEQHGGGSDYFQDSGNYPEKKYNRSGEQSGNQENSRNYENDKNDKNKVRRGRGNQFEVPPIQGPLPSNQEAEQAVLGSMFKDKKCVPQVVEALKEDDFLDPMNRDIYKVIYGLFNMAEKVELVLVNTGVRKLGKYPPDDVKNYLLYLVRITPTAANVGEYINLVKEATLLRKLATITDEITKLALSNLEDGSVLLDAAEQKLSALRRGRATGGLSTMDEVMDEVQEEMMVLAENNSDVSGMSTGLIDLDRAISGLNNSDLILLAARPGMGKTSMALNLLLEAGKHSGKNVVFFSLEMSRLQLGFRLLATESFVDNKKLTTGTLNDKDWDIVQNAVDALVQTNILIDDDSMITVAEINAKCRRVENLGLIIIDYLQLMQSAGGKSGGGENRQQVVSDMSRNLKLMAKDLNVPVICLSQLSRASEKRENKRPMLSDLRESGAIEQDADIVMFLYREDYYDKDTENQNVAECIVAKNRRGETGTVELAWLPQFTTFRTLEKRFEDPYA